ncbi:SpoIIE family protein phosphatase [Modestobacter sp. VKM Ac-2983]|uniref:SpoIIE family protein phosphatase n=1 Tax=Modestobacter sp. VKM Ac-2983 TaxID=3004137 RepID=UPI0022ABABCF|nr:SpoIIE family protein phosphatase [Modestobacter sp. VKM Ac-2983]MCZ2804457.1 SpoIIE family protein phosphatase [Modestobacter sp. VKM Ac-2983]
MVPDFAMLFAALPTAHLVLSPDLVVHYANSAYLRTVGVVPEQIVGRRLFDAFPPAPDALDPEGVPYIARSFERAGATGRPDALPIERYPVVNPDTGLVEDRWWALIAIPVLDEDGKLAMFLQRVDDLTDYVREQESARSDADRQENLLAQVQRLQAELTARTGEVEAAREIERRTSRTVEAMPSGFVSLDTEWRFTLLNPAAEGLLGHSRDELLGRTIWEVFPDTVGTDYEAAYRTAVETREPQSFTAWYPAPLDGWYDVLCWPTADGVSLYFSDVTDRKRSEAEAEASAARLALVARVNAELAEAVDVPAAVAGLPSALVPGLADACIVTVVDGTGRPWDVGWAHADPALRPVLDRYVSARAETLAHSPLTRVLETGRPETLSTAELAALLPAGEARRQLDLLGDARAVKLPLRGRGKVFGALTLLCAASRPLARDWRSTAQDVADRIGLALDNARSANAQATIAESLQRSLLTDPPEPDHAQILVRYLPAAEAAQVGGDWYDAFLQPGGTTMLVIGDVAGHDTAAAAAMGQLRGLLRGIAAYSNAGPVEVLRGLDESMETLMVRTIATAAIARFEQTPEELRQGVTRLVWASAGHPPPLVISPDGEITVLDDGRADLLLGVDPAAQRRERALTLQPGASVLLYTDGLIERRDATLDDGLERLVDAVAGLAGATLDELCDGVLDQMVHGRPDDDVALVAVRLHPQDRPRPAEAGLNVVPASLEETE